MNALKQRSLTIAGNFLLNDRFELADFFSGRGVEIGVHLGVYSDRILENQAVKHLYSVDPWLAECPLYKTVPHADDCYDYTMRRLFRYGARSTVYRGDGRRFGRDFPPNSMDFVYIDSSHEYEETLDQCRLWWSKLSPEGMLCGHDYINSSTVKQAVDEFAASVNGTLFFTRHDSDITMDHPVNSWILFK